MAVTVAEIMNYELFSVCVEEAAGDVTSYLLALGITAAPVLDDDGRPIGFVALNYYGRKSSRGATTFGGDPRLSWVAGLPALRDLVDAPPGLRIADTMSSPADVVVTGATIREAAALMARRSRHHLVCVDVEGRAVGFVSLLDVVRALVGAQICHPDSFPHYDPTTGLQWTNPIQLGLAMIETAPPGAGVLALIDGTPDRPDRVVWSEVVDDVRCRLRELATRPGAAPAHVREAALTGHLWFRAATMSTASRS